MTCRYMALSYMASFLFSVSLFLSVLFRQYPPTSNMAKSCKVLKGYPQSQALEKGRESGKCQCKSPYHYFSIFSASAQHEIGTWPTLIVPTIARRRVGGWWWWWTMALIAQISQMGLAPSLLPHGLHRSDKNASPRNQISNRIFICQIGNRQHSVRNAMPDFCCDFIFLGSVLSTSQGLL